MLVAGKAEAEQGSCGAADAQEARPGEHRGADCGKQAIAEAEDQGRGVHDGQPAERQPQQHPLAGRLPLAQLHSDGDIKQLIT